MRTILLLVSVSCVGLSACQVAPPTAPAPTAYDAWTTPPDGHASPAPRLARQSAPAWTQRPAQPSPWTIDAEVALLSRYVWRGQPFTDDPVLQPAVTVGWEGWRLGVWGNLDLSDVNGNAGAFNEVDVTLEYGRELAVTPTAVRGFAGAILYAFPNTTFDTTLELYGGLELGLPLTPSIRAYYDVVEVDGLYASFDLQHELELPLGSLHLAAGVGWGSASYNRGYFGVEGAGLNDLHLLVAWPLSSEGWTVKPSVAFSALLDGDLRGAAPKNDLWIFGLSVSRSL